MSENVYLARQEQHPVELNFPISSNGRTATEESLIYPLQNGLSLIREAFQ